MLLLCRNASRNSAFSASRTCHAPKLDPPVSWLVLDFCSGGRSRVSEPFAASWASHMREFFFLRSSGSKRDWSLVHTWTVSPPFCFFCCWCFVQSASISEHPASIAAKSSKTVSVTQVSVFLLYLQRQWLVVGERYDYYLTRVGFVCITMPALWSVYYSVLNEVNFSYFLDV